MIPLALSLTVFCLAIVVCVTGFIQLLYLEALRFRPRETAALEMFKEELEDRLGFRLERGALSFSVIKFTAVLLLGICYAFFSVLIRDQEPFWQTAAETIVFSWLILALTAYLLPHLLYRRSRARWLLPLAPLIRVLAMLVKPLIAVVDFMQNLAELTEAKSTEDDRNGNHNEEIEAYISAGEEEGILEEEERRLIGSVVSFRDKTAREAMTPRPKIVGISAQATLSELRDLVAATQHSRIPVYRQSIDFIEGFVRVRDLFRIRPDQLRSKRVAELMRPVNYVPETKRISELLREFQKKGEQMAVIIDEYGNTAGLITLEDLIEEIIGEIRDEHEMDLDITSEPDGAYLVAGNVDLDRLDEILGFRPSEDTESTTVGGLVTEWLGRVPPAGEVIERDGLRIHVLKSDDRKVEQVRIQPLEKAQEDT